MFRPAEHQALLEGTQAYLYDNTSTTFMVRKSHFKNSYKNSTYGPLTLDDIDIYRRILDKLVDNALDL